MESRTIQKIKNSTNPIVIVGTGPVGIRMADELLKIDPNTKIVMYGDEPWEPYNRIGLSSLLAGEITIDDIKNPVKAENITNLVQHNNCSIVSINKKDKVVIDFHGNEQPYEKLILAIGSRPHRPNIPGVNLSNVYTFRDMQDVDRLFARRVRTRRTVIIGGGLLGLEAARAMQKYNTKVTIIEHSKHLMSRQIDEALSNRLLEKLLSLNINVCLKTNVKKVLGETSVTGLALNTGKTIECDTVIVATGVIPNKKLAQDAGIVAVRGIKVNDNLQTSDPNIYSVGECCEHNSQIYGLVAPGFEQAAVCAQVLQGKTAVYKGSINVSKLKVFGFPVYSVGETGDDAEDLSNVFYTYQSNDNETIHTLVIRHRRLVGAMGMGSWTEFERIQDAVRNKRRVWPWQISAFRKTGLLWNDGETLQVSHWPENSMICNCKSISRGQISQCINKGAKSLDCIKTQTGASTVCGSCEPLVSSLLGETSKISPQLAWKTLGILTAIVAVIISAYTLFPNIPYSTSVQNFNIDVLWSDPLYKQITGYTLAGTTLFGVILLTLRKRSNIKKMGNMVYWRINHVALSLFALTILFLHTGINTGSNLNFYLLLFFILASLVGVFASLLNAFEHKISPYRVKQWRGHFNKMHIITSWPLPVLLGFHITSTYYF